MRKNKQRKTKKTEQRWQLGFEIPLRLRKKFREICEDAGTSMKEVLNQFIESEVFGPEPKKAQPKKAQKKRRKKSCRAARS